MPTDNRIGKFDGVFESGLLVSGDNYKPLPGVIKACEDNQSLSDRLDIIEEKIDTLSRKINFIFGDEVLIDGKFRRLKKLSHMLELQLFRQNQ